MEEQAKQGNIIESMFEGLANIMAKQEAWGDVAFDTAWKKCAEHKEYTLVGIVTVLSIGLYFLITTGILGSFLVLLWMGILMAAAAVIIVMGRGSDSYWHGYIDGSSKRHWW